METIPAEIVEADYPDNGVRCGWCNHSWLRSGTKQDWLKKGWERRWSWRGWIPDAFGFADCALCVRAGCVRLYDALHRGAVFLYKYPKQLNSC